MEKTKQSGGRGSLDSRGGNGQFRIVPDTAPVMLHAVTNAMAAFLQSGDWHEASTRLLQAALKHTSSEYGFIGALAGDSRLRILAHEGIVWDQLINRELYEAAERMYAESGYWEFTSLDNLFGAALVTGKPILCNDPASDPRARGVPSGHPALRHFLGVPMIRGDDAIGIIGVANRPNGYTSLEQGNLEVLAQTGSVLYDAYRRLVHETQTQEELRKAHAELESRVRERTAELSQACADLEAEVADRRRAEEELRFARELSQALSRCETVDAILRVTLSKVCHFTGWVAGQAWMPSSDDSALECHPVWYASVNGLEEFRKVSLATKFEAGVGLPGRIWSSRKVAWIKDVTEDDDFPRAPLAKECRLAAAMGVPVLAQNKVMAVLEFFVFDAREEDGRLMELIASVGTELGLLLERKQSDMALRSTEKRTRLILNKAFDPFVGMDEEGRVTDWNSQAEVTFGWSREEAIGQVLADMIIPEKYRGAHWKGLQHFLTTGEGPVLNKRIEISAIHRQGHEFPVELTITPLRFKNHYIFSAFVHDISERKKAEVELKKAKEAAEAASHAKGQFLANVSHEVRTPLNGIIGMTELALDSALLPEQRDYLTMVKSSAESLLTLINDLLDFSKIEAGRFDLDRISFSLRDTLNNVVRPLALRAHTKGLEFSLRVAPAVPDTLIGDPTRLSQIIINLVGNAIKFTSRGEVVIEANHATFSENEVSLQFEVRDTGIGIPPNRQSAIFEPFVQADSSMTRQFGGTGLGLAISARLVELMGGRLQVESVAGAGSTFKFAARFGIADEVQKSVTPTTSSRLATVRALIVDDNPNNRRVLAEMLNDWNMKCAAAEGGPAALGMLLEAQERGDPFAIAIVDSMMPDMDGYALAAKIQENPRLSGTEMIMMTSGDTGDAGRCRSLGIETFLMKPVKPRDLLDAILMVLQMSWQRRSVLKQPPAPTERPARSVRILLVEDNAVNQTLARSLLQKAGHQVTVAGNGREALDLLDRECFDLILMDVQMPVLDGLSATTAIREKEKATGAHIPIVAMTAHAMKEDRERCLQAGMDDYISKPIRTKILLDTIQRLCPAES